MVRGWFRPKQGPNLPPSTNNDRRGEYDSWEPLSRLLLRDIHQKADRLIRSRREAKRRVACDAAPSDQASNTPEESAAERDLNVNPPVTSEHSTDSPSTSMDAAQHTSHSSGSLPDDLVPASENTQHGHTESGPDSNHSNTVEHHTETAPETTPHPTASPPATADPNESHSTNDHTSPGDIVAAHYAEPLPPYQDHTSVSLLPRLPYYSAQTEPFCANCDPFSQAFTTTTLLSDYVCSRCWYDFVRWYTRGRQGLRVYAA
jgi:hypothetical protein